MKVNIICIGRIKEKYFDEAILEYRKRLKSYVELNIIELKEDGLKVENEANIEKAKIEEGKRILKEIEQRSRAYNILLAINGKEYSTLDLYQKIESLKTSGYNEINFIIGGTYGVSNDIYEKVDLKLSFSKLTFPHQLFRIILLEQIYRIFKIENNEPYHK